MNQGSATGLSAVLLAAGESRRMGDTNKLTLPVAGQALLRRTAETLSSCGLVELVVVVGYQQDIARELLRGLPLRIIYNADFRDGQMTSVSAGLAALEQSCRGVMICLSDQVLLDAEDIGYIRRGFDSCPTSIMVPVHQGQRGNPVVLDYSHREAILADPKNLGCRRLIDNNPELVTALEMPNDHVLVDVDTPEAYAAVRQRLGEKDPATTTLDETG
jgi:molybdenum cofactor cytidylyltransferase